jgi:hypothetical protein
MADAGRLVRLCRCDVPCPCEFHGDQPTITAKVFEANQSALKARWAQARAQEAQTRAIQTQTRQLQSLQSQGRRKPVVTNCVPNGLGLSLHPILKTRVLLREVVDAGALPKRGNHINTYPPHVSHSD